MTRLELALKKLERLEKEYKQAVLEVFEHQKTTHGSPVNDKRGASTFFRNQEQLKNKAMQLDLELQMQKERVAKLKNQEVNKKAGLTAAGGLKTSINNIEVLQKRIRDNWLLVAKREHTKTTRQRIKQDEEKLAMLLNMVEIVKTVELDNYYIKLIDKGVLKQYLAQPTVYFIKGLKKIAVELQKDGTFKMCSRYPAYEKEHKDIVNNIINKKY